MRNLQIGVNKLVGKVLINLLHHAKFISQPNLSKLATCVIRIIINAYVISTIIDASAIVQLSKLYS